MQTVKLMNNITKKKILIVDDEIELCKLLENFLIKKNYEVSISHTLDRCRQLIKEHTFDFVFLDNNLPDGIGWEIAPLIVENSPNTFIAFISAYNPIKFGLPEFAKYKIIEKPLRFSEIEKDLDTILKA